MAKNKMAYALSAAALIASSGIFMPLDSFADGGFTILDSCEGIENCASVTNTDELRAAFDDEKTTIIVGDSFDLVADLYPAVDTALYLNNNVITSEDYSLVLSSELTIYAGENGKIVETGGRWAPFYVYGSLILNSGTIETAGTAVYVAGEDVSFTMESGTITGGSSSASTITVGEGAKFVMQDGVINGSTWGVSVFKDAEFEMNGGVINMTDEGSIGVSGNGSTSGSNEGTNAKLTLNAGTINSKDLGVYAPQVNGVTTLGEGLTINAALAGVEIRAGELVVDGATISVDAEAPYVFNPNGSGSTASGVGIAVAQHTTKQPITVTVNSGNFTAPVAFAEGNPQSNAGEDVEKVEATISGGNFNATNGEPVVASVDLTGFVRGGTYNKVPEARYVADDYEVYPYEGAFVVDGLSHAYQSDAVLLQKGESLTLDLGEVENKYATLTIDDEEIATIDGRTLTGDKEGSSRLVINYNTQLNPMSTSVDLTVYSIEIEGNETMGDEDEQDVTSDVIQGVAAGVVSDFINNGEADEPYVTEEAEMWDLAGLKAAIVDGEQINSTLDVHTIDMSDEEWVESIREEFADEIAEDENVAMIYFINIPIYAGNLEDGNVYGQIVKLGEKIVVRLGIPADLPEVAEGFHRVFSVIRSHGDELERLESAVDGDEIVFESDLFSEFALVYVDVEDETEPDDPVEPTCETDPTMEGCTEPTDEPTDEPADEPTDEEAGSPDTGTVTATGASAMSASIVTAIAVGFITAILSFVFLMRRRDSK